MKTMGPARDIAGEEELKTGHLVDNSLTGRTIDFAIELFKSVIFLFYIFLFTEYTYIQNLNHICYCVVFIVGHRG